jgi:glutamine synthetase
MPAERGVGDRYARHRDLHALVESDAYASDLSAAHAHLSQHGVRGVYLTFPSVDGRALAKLVGADRLDLVARSGIRLHYGSISDARSDLSGKLIGFDESEREAIGVPDFSTLRILPWAPTMARVLCFLYDEDTGQPLDHDSRGNLLRLEAEFAQATGLEMMCSIEPEMMWLKSAPDGSPMLASHARAVYSYRNFHEYELLISELIELCDALGIPVHGVDSEESSQLEFNQVPTTPLEHADNLFTYRQLCYIAARRHGLVATFMPKPFMGESGNGAHHNLSLLDAERRNVLVGDLKGPCRLSSLGSAFVGGILEHADAMTFVGAPTINSFKRYRDQGHWAPFRKSFGYNNRTCLVRIAAVGRIEIRHFDSASNSYHTLACCLASGLDGMTRDIDPGAPTSENMFDGERSRMFPSIPLTPPAAADAFRADDLMRKVFPPKLYDTLVALREDEWQRYWCQVSPWEVEAYLERWP